MKRVRYTLLTALGWMLASASWLASNSFAGYPSSCTPTCGTGCSYCATPNQTVSTLPAPLYPNANCTGTPSTVYSLPSPILGNKLQSVNPTVYWQVAWNAPAGCPSGQTCIGSTTCEPNCPAWTDPSQYGATVPASSAGATNIAGTCASGYSGSPVYSCASNGSESFTRTGGSCLPNCAGNSSSCGAPGSCVACGTYQICSSGSCVCPSGDYYNTAPGIPGGNQCTGIFTNGAWSCNVSCGSGYYQYWATCNANSSNNCWGGQWVAPGQSVLVTTATGCSGIQSCNSDQTCSSGTCTFDNSCSASNLSVVYNMTQPTPYGICNSSYQYAVLLYACYPGNTNCSSPIVVSCSPYQSNPTGGGGGSTPFLFTLTKGKYYIENDVMSTVRDQYYEVAKDWYENNSGDPFKNRLTEYYKLSLAPDVSKEGIKLQLREIDPEESDIDQVRLIRIIHPQGSHVFDEQESNTIMAVRDEKRITAESCIFNGRVNCLKEISQVDGQYIEGRNGDILSVDFNIKGLDKNHLYLDINSWGKQPPPLQPAPFKASAAGSLSNFYVIDPDHPENAMRLKDIHPREIGATFDIALGDAIKNISGDKVRIKFQWTQHHYIDYIGLIESPSVSFRSEELSLIKAVHSNGSDVLNALKNKDKVYAHTVRGEWIDLTFEAPKTPLKADEEENYFFVSSGFYHGLRTYIYTHVDPSLDSSKKEIKAYVDQLNKELSHQEDGS